MNKQLDLNNTKVYSNTKEDIIKALSLIGEDVYMSDDENFEDYYKYKLVGVKVIDDYCRFLGNEGKETYTFAYKHFILVKDIKFKEETPGPSYRKFKSIDEFEFIGAKYHFSMGESIIIRNKETLNESELVYNGFFINDESETFICLGAFVFSFDELFKYEFYINNSIEEWRPFGIKEW